jgi:O-antigen/teichoic acid export membrane protein
VSLVLFMAAAGGLALLWLGVSRPQVACVLLAAAIPITAGLGRGTVVPVLRVNEALLLLVVGGVVLGAVPRRRPLMFTGLDVVVLAFCVGSVLIPWAVILLTHAPADQQDWMTVLAPAQYLIVYLLYSRVNFSPAHVRLLLNLIMLVSLPVGLIAVAQLLDLGGIRTLLDAYYPTEPMPSWDTIYRPASLLGFYSAVGAFGLLNFLLALALAAVRHPGFAQPWLAVVMGVNVVGILATQTYAPLLALPVGAAAVLIVARRVPWGQLAAAPPALITSAVILWPVISNRVQQELTGGGGSVLKLPESIALRVDYWQSFFVPALLKHGLWLGTGTLIPSEVPRPLVTFVDNGYLWQAFRAGLPGLALYLLLLATIARTAWNMRSAEDPSRRVVAAVCAGLVVSLVLLDTTSEYLLMTGVSQEFWMLAGLLTGLALVALPSRASIVEIGAPTPGWWERRAGWRGRPIGWRTRPVGSLGRPAGSLGRPVGPLGRPAGSVGRPAGSVGRPVSSLGRPAGSVERAVSSVEHAAGLVGRAMGSVGRPAGTLWGPVGSLGRPMGRRTPSLEWMARSVALARRLAPGRALVQSSLVVLVGGGLGSLLGFGFQVVSGRLLNPTGYGRLAFALTVAGIASILLSTGPVGLSRFLSRHADSRSEQESYYTNWLAVIAVLLGASVLVTAIVVPAIGLSGWLLAGVIANLFGVTALATFREVQRGLGRFTLLTAFLVLANTLQLVAIVVAGALGWRSPALFLIFYGLSGVAALPFVLPLSRNGPRLVAAALDWSRVKHVLRFLSPILIQAIFWNLWFSGDLVMVQHFAGPTATGIYGAAKAIANGFELIPGAITFVFAPQVARLAITEVRGHLVRTMTFTAAMLVPGVTLVMLVGTPLTVAIFGPRYHATAAPLAVLAVGMAIFGLKNVMGSLWLGLGYPIVEMVSSAASMVATFAAGLLLIPSHGAVGAALAFSAGAMAQMLIDGGVTLWAFGGRTPRVAHLKDRPVAKDLTTPLEPRAADRRLRSPETPTVLLFAEDVAPVSEQGYARFVVELGAFLSVRGAVVRRVARADRVPGFLPWRALVQGRALLRTARSLKAKGSRGAAVTLYASRTPVTLPALLRARMLRLLSRPAPVAMIAMRGCSVRPAWLLRRLAPDLLVLPGIAECDVARRQGVNAAVVWDGLARLADAPNGRIVLGVGQPWDTAPPEVDPGAWPAIGERLLSLVDDLVLLRASTRPRWSRVRVVAVQARRSYVARRDWWRRLRWGDRVAYEAQEPRVVAASVVKGAAAPPALAATGQDLVGLMATAPDVAIAAAAELAGLRLETAARRGPEDLVRRALEDRWPLLHLRSEHLDALAESVWSRLAAYVNAGGTLYVDGLKPARQERLAVVCDLLGVKVPTVTGVSAMDSLSFPAERTDFARELAGTRLHCPAGRTAISAGDGWEVLAYGGRAVRPLPVMVRHDLGRGALILATASSELEDRLTDALAPGSRVAMAAVLPIVLLRCLYGSTAWHPPATLANFTVDDPALRRGVLGLRWDLLLAQARDHGFHATIATVPRELAMADPAVVGLLRRHRELLTACYHGCNHDSYEFYSPEATRTRYRPRPLSDQRRLLEHAVECGRKFEEVQGVELERVMVFPYGVGPAEIFGDLHRLGFLGTCNYSDKYPPGSKRPDDADLGLRPADLAWAGFPLLWRRSVEDGGHLIDLLLGRPLLAFAHTPSLGADFAPFVELAERINQSTGGAATWCGLDEVARHAYLQRRRPDGVWEVLMTTNEACFHNPEPEPRTFAVRRPHLPPRVFFEVDGKRVPDSTPITVPGRGNAVVRLVSVGEAPALAGRQRCSIVRT